jgi:hypothetical protein
MVDDPDVIEQHRDAAGRLDLEDEETLGLDDGPVDPDVLEQRREVDLDEDDAPRS